MKNKTEFKAGDIVTFKPYEKAIKAKVVEIVPANKVTWLENDERVFYKLTGVDRRQPLTTTTTGKSITESVLYDSVDVEEGRALTMKEKGIIEEMLISKGVDSLDNTYFVDINHITARQACDTVYRMTGRPLTELLNSTKTERMK